MDSLRLLCRETFQKCFAMFKKPDDKDKHEYKNVDREMKQQDFSNDDFDDEENFAAWPSQNASTTNSSLNTTSGDKVEKRVLKNDEETSPHRPILIGNIDEENIKKKNDFHDSGDALFDQFNMTTGLKPAVKIGKPVINNKKSIQKEDKMDKFKMDEELEPADAWIDDSDINI